MTSTQQPIEFTPASADTPWQLAHPLPTDIRAVVRTADQPTPEWVGKALASFIGESIQAEEIEPPDTDVPWAMNVRVEGLPSEMLVWVEPLNDASSEASGVDTGWILAVQTVLHSGDPLTHFSNLLRLFAGSELNVECICDIATGRWFPREILDKIFVGDTVQPPEEILWITRVAEAPQESEPEERWAWVTTHGLARCGRVELEMLGVSSIVTSEAVQVVDGLAALTLESPLPAVGQVMSIGPDLLVSLLQCNDAIELLEKQMPGFGQRTIPSVAIASHDGNNMYPLDALNSLRSGETAVAKTSRFTNRRACMARETWKLLLDAAEHIGENEHAACMVQVPWTNSEEEDSPSEYLWFRVIKVEALHVIGSLAHEPRFATTLLEGHEEKLTADDVTDWLVMTPVGPMGPSDAEAIAEFLTQFTT